MDLKIRRIALHIDDPKLGWQLSALFTAKGAIVHRAKDEVELGLFVDRLGADIIVARVRPDRSSLN